MKHIEKLANKLAKEAPSSYYSNYWTMEKEIASLINTLEAIKKALLNGRFYAGVQSVSSSGMSRIIKLKYIENNRLYHIDNELILKLAGCDKNGRIHGCGMDMLFAAQYNLWTALFTKKPYQQMKQYRSF